MKMRFPNKAQMYKRYTCFHLPARLYCHCTYINYPLLPLQVQPIYGRTPTCEPNYTIGIASLQVQGCFFLGFGYGASATRGAAWWFLVEIQASGLFEALAAPPIALLEDEINLWQTTHLKPDKVCRNIRLFPTTDTDDIDAHCPWASPWLEGWIEAT